jgi:hypothetical protein
MFDFTSLFHAVNASRIVERNGKQILMALVGDSLLEVNIAKRKISFIDPINSFLEFLANRFRCWFRLLRTIRYSLEYIKIC